MGSLRAHMRQTEAHGRLPFHPDCPICRGERLVGDLPAEGVVSRRSLAAVAAGLMAFSTAAPGAVAAQVDGTSEGAAVPQEVAPGNPAEDPDFDPGGAPTNLPFETTTTPQAQAPPDPDDEAPLDPEPTTDVDAPVADQGDDISNVEGEQQPTPVSEAPSAAAAPAEESAHAPTADPAVGETGSGASESFALRPTTNSPEGKGERKERRTRPASRADETTAAAPKVASARGVGGARPAPSTHVLPAPSSSDTVTVTAVEPPPAPSSVVAGARSGRAAPGDRFHVVRPGESLWSIAGDVLGEDATVARIAREVNRLWELNSERIGTGDRDLILVGTRLRLR